MSFFMQFIEALYRGFIIHYSLRYSVNQAVQIVGVHMKIPSEPIEWKCTTFLEIKVLHNAIEEPLFWSK